MIGTIPVPDQAKEMINAIGAKHQLTLSEIEWALTCIEDDYGFLSATQITPNWKQVGIQLDMIMQWARETGNSVLEMGLSEALDNGRSHFVDKQLVKSFGGQEWITRYIRNKDTTFKTNLATLNSMVDGGMTREETSWAFDKGKLANMVVIRDPTMRSIADVIKWTRTTGTQLSTFNDLETPSTLAHEWADYERKRGLSRRLSHRNLRTIKLSGNWKAVFVDPEAIASPPGAIDNPDYSPTGEEPEDHDYEIEQQITGISLRTTNHCISVRDQNGVPQATIELSAANPTTGMIDVYEIASTVAAKPKVKELVAVMAKAGTKMWRAGDADTIDTVRELAEWTQDEYGLVPAVSLRQHGLISGIDGYLAAINDAYSEGWGGSYFYANIANGCIDALVDYAEQRNELDELEDARQQFYEESQESWWTAEEGLIQSGVLPKKPNEDDAKYNRGGKFNAKKFETDQDAWYKLSAPHEEEHEPHKLDNYAYKLINERMEKPENKPFYDAVRQKQEAERQQRRKEEEARELAERVDSMREHARQNVDELADSMGDIDIDDHEIIASRSRPSFVSTIRRI